MGSLLIAGGTVVTLGSRNRVLPDHSVFCQDGVVSRIAPRSELTVLADSTIDARGKVVVPGFINAHTHFYSTLVRGLTKAEPAAGFQEVLEHLWWRLDRALEPEDCQLSALIALIEAIRHGTTTLVDHHASPHAARGSLDALAGAVTRVGVRACLCYELSDRDGAAVAADGLAENVAFLERCRRESDPHLRALFGLHAAFTLSDATLERAVAEAARLGAGFHLHVAEAAADQEHGLHQHGARVVERLHRLGVLGRQTIAAHCVHVDGREMDTLAATDTAVVHCPQSNMNNAVGVADVPAMIARGVLVGLGTDAMTENMLEELRAALWVRHLAAGDPSGGWPETLATLLAGNAAIADRLWPGIGIGELREGGAADLVLIDYQPPTPLDEITFAGHLLFGLSQASVDTTIVAGRVLMAGRKLCLDLDEAELAARARERSRALWERF